MNLDYFYPRPPRGGRLTRPALPSAGPYFYPRPPRGGRPLSSRASSFSTSYFYPRPPRGGRRQMEGRGINCTIEFLSTPSARRATRSCAAAPPAAGHFYPRPPRGGRRCGLDAAAGEAEISIHALREEGDSCICYDELYKLQFLSTPSARRATVLANICAGCFRNFYPRPPRGGRPSLV